MKTTGLLFIYFFGLITILIDATSPTLTPTSSPTAVQFAYTGNVQTYNIPANAEFIKVTLVGASGGTAQAGDSAGGKGARVECTFAAPASTQFLYIFVGGKGNYGITPGGYNGGGDSTYGDSCSGGGATDVRTSQIATSYSTRLAVAGGGGGGEGYCDADGGYGGHPSGSTGGDDTCSLTDGGNPGTQTAGGAGGSRTGSGAGDPGVSGKGGKGCPAGGAGGGGGYFGGGGTCGGGGGGGSSFCISGGVFANDANVGNGYAIVDFIAAPTTNPTLTPTANPSRAPSATPSTATPTLPPTLNPTRDPTLTPSVNSSPPPTFNPTKAPTFTPSATTSPTPPQTLLSTAVQFAYTGSSQTYNVPANAELIKVTLVGASGGGTGQAASAGGRGARVECTFAPTSSILYIFVGGQGSSGITPGGFNGGGDSTYIDACSGGGATDVRTSLSATGYATRLAVAGGGGGGERYCSAKGGYGGNPSGSAGGFESCNLTSGGGPGTQTGGGSGGTRSGSGTGDPGAIGKGGNGCIAGGSGGGGGYFGGGGTCKGGGGGRV